MRKALNLFIGLLIVGSIVFLVMRTPDTDAAQMIAKYGGEAARFVETQDGLKVHYRQMGRDDGPTLLLVHGSNSSLQTWEPLAARLGDAYRIIALDLPGHGLTGSTPDARYDATAMLAAIETVLAATWTDRFTVIGNSMGSWVSWRLALAMPERVDAVVLTAASGAPYDEPPEGLPVMRIAQYGLGRWVLRHITPRRVIEESVRANFTDQSVVDDAMIDRYWELLRYPGNRQAALDRLVANREHHYWTRIGDIKAPVLLVWGTDDTLVPIAQAAKFQAALPQSRLIVYEDVGHLPMEEVPDQLAGDIKAWLMELTAPTEPEPPVTPEQ